jgi:hypothetical protein
VTISTRLLNDSHTDAGSARVTLGLAAAQLVSGAATQSVSGGTLEKQTTSEQHTWTVRQSSPGSARATIQGIGSVEGEQSSYTRTLTLDCERFEARIAAAKYRYRGPTGALTATGAVTPAGTGLTPQGQVRFRAVRSAKGARKSARSKAKETNVPLNAAGRFTAELPVCKPGRWEAFASYLGSGAYDTSRVDLGVVKVKRRQVRC